MLSNIQKNIILRAVRIRMSEGEDLEMILESYPRLTDARKMKSELPTGRRRRDMGRIWVPGGIGGVLTWM